MQSIVLAVACVRSTAIRLLSRALCCVVLTSVFDILREFVCVVYGVERDVCLLLQCAHRRVQLVFAHELQHQLDHRRGFHGQSGGGCGRRRSRDRRGGGGGNEGHVWPAVGGAQPIAVRASCSNDRWMVRAPLSLPFTLVLLSVPLCAVCAALCVPASRIQPAAQRAQDAHRGMQRDAHAAGSLSVVAERRASPLSRSLCAALGIEQQSSSAVLGAEDWTQRIADSARMQHVVPRPLSSPAPTKKKCERQSNLRRQEFSRAHLSVRFPT